MFGFLKKKKQKEPDLEKLIEIADILSNNDSKLHAAMVYCLDETLAYSRQYAQRYAQRGIDAERCDRDTIRWIALADELEDAGWLASVDTACEAEDLHWSLSQLNSVRDRGLTIPELESEDFDDWLAEYKLFFQKHGLILCQFPMDSDDYHLILVQKEQYDTVFRLAQLAGRRIEAVD